MKANSTITRGIRWIFLLLWSVALHSNGQSPPLNDNLTNALVVSGESFVLSADVGNATREAFEPFFSGSPGHSVWWKWRVPADGIYAWTNRSATNLAHFMVFEEDRFGQFQVRFSPEVGSGVNRQFGSFEGEEDRIYHLRLDELTPLGMGGFDFGDEPRKPFPLDIIVSRLPGNAPTNDFYASRTRLVGTNLVFAGSLAFATAEEGEPKLPYGSIGRTLWWRWQAPGPGTAIIRTVSTNSVPGIGVFTKSSLYQFLLLASSASEFGNRCNRFSKARNEVRWDTATGVEFDIMADLFPETDFNTPADFELIWLPAPPNDSFDTPTLLAGTDLSLKVNNESATRDVGGIGGGSNTIWFQWSPPSEGIVQISHFEPTRYMEPTNRLFTNWASQSYGLAGITLVDCGPVVDLHPLPKFTPVWSFYERNGDETNGYWAQSDNSVSNIVGWVGNGAVYRIGLDGATNTSGTTNLNLFFMARPSNDALSNRIVLPSSAVEVAGRTFAATADSAQQEPYGGEIWFQPSVWWEWTAPKPGLWALVPQRGDDGNRFVLYGSNGYLPESKIASTRFRPLVFEVTTNLTFRIGVFSENGDGGNVSFILAEAEAPRLKATGVFWNYYGSLMGVDVFPQSAPGLGYIIDLSTNLQSWRPVWTNNSTRVERYQVPMVWDSPLFFRSRVDR